MITVYGADWCEDTQRSLRHLRRLHIPYHYSNVDEDLAALERAQALNDGRRRTPTIDLGMGGSALIEPDNDTLTSALVEMQMLTRDDALERLGYQNVGDMERIARTAAGLAILATATAMPRRARWLFGALGMIVTGSGVSGWCPLYHAAGVTSLGGPGDRPAEAERRDWFVPRAQLQPPASGAETLQ